MKLKYDILSIYIDPFFLTETEQGYKSNREETYSNKISSRPSSRVIFVKEASEPFVYQDIGFSNKENDDGKKNDIEQSQNYAPRAESSLGDCMVEDLEYDGQDPIILPVPKVSSSKEEVPENFVSPEEFVNEIIRRAVQQYKAEENILDDEQNEENDGAEFDVEDDGHLEEAVCETVHGNSDKGGAKAEDNNETDPDVNKEDDFEIEDDKNDDVAETEDEAGPKSSKEYAAEVENDNNKSVLEVNMEDDPTAEDDIVEPASEVSKEDEAVTKEDDNEPAPYISKENDAEVEDDGDGAEKEDDDEVRKKNDAEVGNDDDEGRKVDDAEVGSDDDEGRKENDAEVEDDGDGAQKEDDDEVRKEDDAEVGNDDDEGRKEDDAVVGSDDDAVRKEDDVEVETDDDEVRKEDDAEVENDDDEVRKEDDDGFRKEDDAEDGNDDGEVRKEDDPVVENDDETVTKEASVRIEDDCNVAVSELSKEDATEVDDDGKEPLIQIRKEDEAKIEGDNEEPALSMFSQAEIREDSNKPEVKVEHDTEPFEPLTEPVADSMGEDGTEPVIDTEVAAELDTSALTDCYEPATDMSTDTIHLSYGLGCEMGITDDDPEQKDASKRDVVSDRSALDVAADSLGVFDLTEVTPKDGIDPAVTDDSEPSNLKVLSEDDATQDDNKALCVTEHGPERIKAESPRIEEATVPTNGSPVPSSSVSRFEEDSQPDPSNVIEVPRDARSQPKTGDVDDSIIVKET